MQRRLLRKLNECKSAQEFVKRLMNMPEAEVTSLFSSLEPFRFHCGDTIVRARKHVDGDNPWGIRPWHTGSEHVRFDKNQGILYAAGSQIFLPHELKLNAGEQYFLGTYTVIKPFCVGTLMFCNDEFPNISRYLSEICKATHIGNISEGTKEKIQLEENAADKIAIVPYHVGIKYGPELYRYTNWIGTHVIGSFKNGFLFASSYDTVYFQFGRTSFRIGDRYENLNMALTQHAMKFLKFPTKSQECIADEEDNPIDTIVSSCCGV